MSVDDVPRAPCAGGLAAPGTATRRRRRDTSCSTPGRSVTACARCRRPSPGDLFFDMEGDGLARDVPLEYLFGAVDTDGDVPRVVGPRRGRGAARVRGVRRLRDRAARSLPRHAHLPLRGVREDRAAPADEPARHARGGGRSPAPQRSARRPLSRGAAGHPAVHRLVLAQEGRASVHAGTRGVDRRRRGQHGHVRALVDQPRGRRRRRRRAARRDRDVQRARLRSTALLRDWLEARRVEEEALRGAPIERPPVIERAPSATRSRRRSSRPRRSRPRWSPVCPADSERADRCGASAKWLLAPLLSYHRRENKVNWWRHFDQIAMSPEELERDTYALGPLEMIGSREDGRRIIERYRFEPQEHRIGIGDKPLDPEVGRSRLGAGRRRGDRTRLRARGDHAVAHAVQADRGPPRFLIPIDADSDGCAGGVAARSRALGRGQRRRCSGLQPSRARPADASSATSERQHRLECARGRRRDGVGGGDRV